MILGVFCTTCCLGSVVTATEDGIDRNQLIRLIEGARSQVTDFAFEYEGEKTCPGQREQQSLRLGPDGVYFSYSGSYSRRSDGATLVEINSVNAIMKHAGQRRISTMNGKTEVSEQLSMSSQPTLAIRPYRYSDFVQTSNYGSLFLSDAVVALARARKPYASEGVQNIDGNECVVVRFQLSDAPQPAPEETVSELFWVDLVRGGHVLRYEQRWGKNLAKLAHRIKLESFTTPSGKMIWLPVSGQWEGHVSLDPQNMRQKIFPAAAVNVESYGLLRTSLRFERGLPDGFFSARASSPLIYECFLAV